MVFRGFLQTGSPLRFLGVVPLQEDRHTEPVADETDAEETDSDEVEQTPAVATQVVVMMTCI